MGDEDADNVAWSYERPPAEVAAIKDLIAFYADRVETIEAATDGD